MESSILRSFEGDTLSEPKLVEGDRLKQFDVVLANPPYSIKQWDREAFASDPWGRNLYGTPPQGRADYAFWQHVLQSLNPKTGRCAILFPHGVLFRQEEAEMRRKMIEDDVVECVLGIGPNLFYNSPMEACVVICRMNKPNPRRGRVLFINAVAEVTRERAQSFLTAAHVARIAQIYADFKEESGFSYVAGIREIGAKDFNVSIPLFVEAGIADRTGNGLEFESIDAWLPHAEVTAAMIKTIVPDLEIPVGQGDLHANSKCNFLEEKTGWLSVRFGDVVENVNETERDPIGAGIGRFIGLEHLEPSSLKVPTWGELSEGTTFTRRCRPGQVLFGKRRAYQRKIAVAEFDAVVSGDIYVLAPKNRRLLAGLLPFLCLSERFYQYAIETSAGSLSPRTNWSSLSEFRLNLPPLDKQRRIADILSALDEVIASGRSSLNSLNQLHNSKRDAWSASDFEGFPLAQLLTYASDGPFGSKLKTEHYASSGARVIRLQNVGEGCFDDSDRAFVSLPYFRELSRYEVLPGDVIVAGLGDEAHPVGRAALVPNAFGPAVNKADCFCLRGDPSMVSNSYLAHYLNSGPGMQQIAAISQGTTRLRVNVGNLKKVRVPLLPKQLQEEMISELAQIEAAKSHCQQSMIRASDLLGHLLNATFGDQS